MKAIISLAARMRSTRLPGKVMAEVAGKPILQLICERLQRSRAEVVISNNENDAEIHELARRIGVRCISAWDRDAGDPKWPDMMSMHWQTAVACYADFILLAGADDPFLDPAIFDMVLDRLERGDVAFVKTAGWPLGLNVWGFTRAALEEGQREATAPDERQHVVPFWERRPKRYPAAVLHRAGEDLYDRFRCTIDGPSDLDLTRAVYDALIDQAPAERVIDFLEAHPEIAALNADGLHGYAARDAIYDLTPIAEPNVIAAVRRYVDMERRAALGAMDEAPEWNAGRAAGLLSVDQWLQYQESIR